jgi:hypothetical protein
LFVDCDSRALCAPPLYRLQVQSDVVSISLYGPDVLLLALDILL